MDPWVRSALMILNDMMPKITDLEPMHVLWDFEVNSSITRKMMIATYLSYLASADRHDTTAPLDMAFFINRRQELYGFDTRGGYMDLKLEENETDCSLLTQISPRINFGCLRGTVNTFLISMSNEMKTANLVLIAFIITPAGKCVVLHFCRTGTRIHMCAWDFALELNTCERKLFTIVEEMSQPPLKFGV